MLRRWQCLYTKDNLALAVCLRWKLGIHSETSLLTLTYDRVTGLTETRKR